MTEPKTTREQIIAIVKEFPTMTMADIARRVDVSRERVRQICAEEGLTVRKGYYGQGERLQASRLTTRQTAVPINTITSGTIAELLVAADLLARGYTVYWPMDRQAAIDLIATTKDGSHVERIEVRCARPSGQDRIAFARKAKTHPAHDRYAVVLVGEPVVYVPPFDGDAPS